jgi:glycosyltransferase involved in cell wall biosynthesis
MRQVETFFIKAGYTARVASRYFEDALVSGTGTVHQPDVYTVARHLASQFGCTHILDIGCGRGIKLAMLHPKFKIVGLDFGTNIEYCRNHYPFGMWLSHDLELPYKELLPPDVMEKTLVICSDVVEHLVDPSGLLKMLRHCLEFAPVAIITTPERDLVRGRNDPGPPANSAHVREWNLPEFLQLLEANSFQVAFAGLTYNNDRDWEKKTIISILHGDGLPLRDMHVSEKFRVVAFMTAYNEEDIILHSIKRLLDAGIEVYLIDNWSTDGTVAAVEPLLGKGLIGIERFPIGGATGTYDWVRLLERVEELARTVSADWFIHHDVDEIRESPWPELRLREALHYVDRMGFNAVDHTVMNFCPIDNGFASEIDFGSYFVHWKFGHRPGHFRQVKAWKALGQSLALARSGGHDADFPGRRVFPYKFLLRHYPVRSQSHGEKKVLGERKPRFNSEERVNRGWHTHYDHIESGHSFLGHPESLNEFNPATFYQEYLVERISSIGIIRERKLDIKNDLLTKFRRFLRIEK